MEIPAEAATRAAAEVVVQADAVLAVVVGGLAVRAAVVGDLAVLAVAVRVVVVPADPVANVGEGGRDARRKIQASSSAS